MLCIKKNSIYDNYFILFYHLQYVVKTFLLKLRKSNYFEKSGRNLPPFFALFLGSSWGEGRVVLKNIAK